jgi:large subunit ribosomal protein L22e
VRFTINCDVPVSDHVLDLQSFVKFLHDKIKVNGKAGMLGDAVRIEADANKINVDAKLPFSKRYLKYLSKKYLKKQQLRDYLHVISTDASTYELRYFNITDAGDGADDEEDEE